MSDKTVIRERETVVGVTGRPQMVHEPVADPAIGTDVGPPKRVSPGGLRRILMLLDVIAVSLVWCLVLISPLPDEPLTLENALVPSLAILTAMAVARGARLYQARVSSNRQKEISLLAVVSVASSFVAVAAAHQVDTSRALVSPFDGLMAAIGVFGALVASRGAFDAWLRDSRSRGHFCRRLVIVGTGAEAIDLYQVLRDHPEFGYRVCGLLGPEPDHLPDWAHWIGPRENQIELLGRLESNGVLVADERMDPEERNSVVKDFLEHGIHVHLSTGLQGFAYRRLQMVPIAHEPLFYLEQSNRSRVQEIAKRVLDVTIASLLLVLTAPLLAGLSLAIRLQDGGPAFFRQDRIGRDGERFGFLKLRTMVTNAEDLKADLVGDNQRSGPLFKAANDPRITRLGRVLRSSSLDELPQLINVVRGEMSLVGPRPALPDEVAEFDEELMARCDVPPGITGLWQVEARDNPTFRAYRRFDLFYVENWSFGLDLVILVLTAQSVVARAVGLLLRRRHDGPSPGGGLE